MKAGLADLLCQMQTTPPKKVERRCCLWVFNLGIQRLGFMFCVFDMQLWGLGFRARALDGAGSNRRFKKGSSYKLLMPMLHTLRPGG